jgi:DNA-binding transcriptional LysR family regulator
VTAAGESLLAQCRTLTAVADRISDATAQTQTPQGWLRVAVPALFADSCLVPLLGRFAERYPKVVLDLQVTDRTVDLVQDRLDVAIRITAALDKAVIARRLGTVRSLLCASPDYVARNGAPERPEQLEQHACLTYAHLGGREWRLFREDETAIVQVDGPLQTNEGLLLLRGAIKGLGITLLPEFAAAQPISQGRLVPILDGWCPAELGLFLLYASRRHLPTASRAFMDFMADELQSSSQLHSFRPEVT